MIVLFSYVREMPQDHYCCYFDITLMKDLISWGFR